MVDLFANSGDPNQTPRSAASDLGLHCLPVTRLGVSGLQLNNARQQNLLQNMRFCLCAARQVMFSSKQSQCLAIQIVS